MPFLGWNWISGGKLIYRRRVLRRSSFFFLVRSAVENSARE